MRSYQQFFADNLARLCKEKHISTDELAFRIDKSSRQVSRYRSGSCENISLATMERIAGVLDVSLTELLSESYNGS